MHMKKSLSLLLVFAMLFALTACVDPQDSSSTAGSHSSGGTATGTNGTYTVKLTTEGGMALSGYQVVVYGDEAKTDPVDLGTTDENGNVKFNLPKGKDYYVELDASKLKGYDLQEVYAFNGTTLDLTLKSSLITDDSLSNAKLAAGDIMYDFEVTSIDGETIKLSELLKEKELVVVNFWYTTCYWCLEEFPVLEQAYQMYADDVAVVGLNYTDDLADVVSFEYDYGIDLSFPLASCPQTWFDAFGTGAAPTSVFIDRYGMICLVEAGAMTSLTQWASVFDHFLGDDYVQETAASGEEWVTQVSPPDPETWPALEEIAATLGGENAGFTCRWDEDAYAWPFLITEKDGRNCIYASNKNIYESYAIVYADVYLEAGQVLAFDYLVSSEANCDVLYVIVNGEDIYSISGLREEWSSAYCWVAETAGTYELALCYQKDSDTDEGEDTCYIANLRVVDIADIDSPSYLPKQAGVANANGGYDYVDIYLNENDGYYHVGSVDGPLLLAGVFDYTQFSQEDYLYRMASEGEIVYEGYNYYNDLLSYFSASTNSNLVGWVPVTAELAEMLKIVDKIKGFDDADDNEWLLMCKYYTAYGTDGVELEDPCAGLKTWSALTATEGTGIATNHFYYNGNPIMPKGKLARFTPEKSGVYRITSNSDYPDTLSGWIFDKDYNMLNEYAGDEMLGYLYCDELNVTMVMYMEAGVDYYIDIAPYDVYAICNVYYDIEYLGETYDLFRSCSVGAFTFIEGSDKIIIRGIDVVLNPADGYYHEDLGKDENGNQLYGSIIYAYFTGGTVSFSNPIYPTIINLGGFDFTYNEYDLEIIAYLKQHDWDVEATDAFLREKWGEFYDTYASNEYFALEDVYAGIYHGEKVFGEFAYDRTEEARAYIDKIIQGDPDHELTGCVPVDAKLAELLQLVMDKYTFDDVDNSWLKFCFYYDHLGPEG